MMASKSLASLSSRLTGVIETSFLAGPRTTPAATPYCFTGAGVSSATHAASTSETAVARVGNATVALAPSATFGASAKSLAAAPRLARLLRKAPSACCPSTAAEPVVAGAEALRSTKGETRSPGHNVSIISAAFVVPWRSSVARTAPTAARAIYGGMWFRSSGTNGRKRCCVIPPA